MLMPPPEPTCAQCTENDIVFENDNEIGYAIWYPQMGGYVGRAVAVMNRHDGCIECYVWHDGFFPFCGDDRSPAQIHHCDPEQFIRFGEKLRKFNQEG